VTDNKGATVSIMKHLSVSNLEAFLKYLDSTDPEVDMDIGNWGFRGVGSDKYELIPSIGRKDVRQNYEEELASLSG
jgi:hypothetical protein